MNKFYLLAALGLALASDFGPIPAQAFSCNTGWWRIYTGRANRRRR